MSYWIWIIVFSLTYVVFKHYKIRRRFTERGVPIVSAVPILGQFGSTLVNRRHVNDMAKEIYDMHESAKYVADITLFSPMLVIRDLDLIKAVLVKNFDHFADHLAFVDEKSDPLFARNLAMINGDKWRETRNLLSPAFTSSKLRTMFELISRCSENFTEKLLELYDDKKSVDVKDVFSRYASDIIATSAFGIEIDSLKNPNNEFYTTGKRCSFNRGSVMIKIILMSFFPKLTDKIGMRFISKKDTDFFINLIDETIKTRAERGIVRPDMLQLMIDSQNKTTDSVNLDMTDITSQCFIFFLAGFDTTSDVMVLLAHELAINSEVQEKLQEEIDSVISNHNGKPTYEIIKNMPYLDAVFNETLRMHPTGFLSRICSKDFELPPALPNSKPWTIKVGTEVVIPTVGIHRDAKYYEDPNKFNPDRYMNKKVNSDVFNMGFGLGPRMCIGNRFAILVIKTLFVHLLAKCSFVPCKKTCVPIKYDPNSVMPVVKGGSWLKIEQRI